MHLAAARPAVRKALPLTAPVALAAAYVIGVYAGSAGHWSTLLRPLGVSVLVALVVTLACLAVTRRIEIATVAATVTVVVFVGPGHAAAAMALLIAGWALRAQWRRMHGQRPGGFPVAATATAAALMLLVSMGGALLGGAVLRSDVALAGQERAVAADRSRPNIYVVLLDGYPRADTLRDVFGYDNQPFIHALADLGFSHYADARSPATRTELTLLSMFGGEVDPDLPPGFEGDVGERRDARDAIQRSMRPLADAGYWRVHIASPIVHTNFTGWDEVIDTGQITELEARLLGDTPVGPLLRDWILEQHRDRLVAAFDALTVQAEAPGQRLVLAHLMAPHPPFLYGGGPSCSSGDECRSFDPRQSSLSLTAAEYAAAFRSQLDGLNPMVLEAVESMVSADPEGIVVVMSDHGARHDETTDDEWRRSLLAVRGTDALDDEHSVRDLFDRLLDDRQ